MTTEAIARYGQKFELHDREEKKISVEKDGYQTARIGELGLQIVDVTSKDLLKGVGTMILFQFQVGSVGSFSVDGPTKEVSLDIGGGSVYLAKNRSVVLKINCKGEELNMKFKHTQ